MSSALHKSLRALRLLEERIQPDEAWVKQTREILRMQVANSLPTERVSVVSALLISARAFFVKRAFPAVRGPALAISSIFVLAFGGSIASVSAAENSLPGDFFFSLKLATEQARLAFTSGKQEKLKLKVEFTKRRAEDLKKVSQTDDSSTSDRVSQGTEILKRDLNTLKQQLDDVKSDGAPYDVADAARLVDQKSIEVVQVLQETKSSLSDESKKKVVEAQAAASDTGVKAIEVLTEKHNESEDVVGKEEMTHVIQDHTKAVADATGSSVISASSTSLSEPSGTTVSLEAAVEQMKTATQQAFAVEQQSLTDGIAQSGQSTSTSGTSVTATTTATTNNSGTTSTKSTTATSTQSNQPTTKSP